MTAVMNNRQKVINSRLAYRRWKQNKKAVGNRPIVIAGDGQPGVSGWSDCWTFGNWSDCPVTSWAFGDKKDTTNPVVHPDLPRVKIGNEVFNVEQVVDRTLFATKRLNVKRLPSDDAPTVFTVESGGPVGTVYSYLLAAPGRSRLYWQFRDANKRYYYVQHEDNAFSKEKLKEQGSMNNQEQYDAYNDKEEEEGDGFFEKLGKAVKQVGGLIVVAGGVYIAAKYLAPKPNRGK